MDKYSRFIVLALMLIFLAGTAASGVSVSVQGNWYDQDKYHDAAADPNGGATWHHNWCADDIGARNHKHDPGETWDEVEHEDWDDRPDHSCWMASAESMLSHWQQGQADMYDSWAYADGLDRNGIVYTFDEGGLQHWGVNDAGEDYQVMSQANNNWQDPIDYVVACMKEDSTVGLAIYGGSMAHAVTSFAINTSSQTITLADSDQDPGGNDYNAYHYSAGGNQWILTNYQNQPEVKYLCAFDVVGWWVAGSGNWNTPMNWVGPTNMNNQPVGCVPDNTKPVYFTQSNLGHVNVNAAAGAKWILMDSQNFGASVNLYAGAALVVEEDLTIGKEKNGLFSHYGGTNTVGGTMYLGIEAASSGRYSLSGGELSVVTEICVGGRFDWFGGQIDTPAMTLSPSATLAMGYNFSVGDLASGSLFVSGGTLTGLDSATLEVTNWATATHAGIIGIGALRVGSAFGAGTYELSGTLTAGVEYIGDGQNGMFTQTGGTHQVIGMLYVGQSSYGYYYLEDGTLDVSNLYIGSQGSFHANNGDAVIEIGQSLTFYDGAEYDAVAGTVIHMTGSNFDNQSTSEMALGGLENTTFIFEGGEGVFDTFEIACLDMGLDVAGLIDNFALYGLILGGGDIGYVQLVDYLDNGNRGGVGGDDEALYVRTLTLNEGSTLDLNGYHLYTLEYNDLGGEVLNGEINLIPEPATIILLGCGLFGLTALLRKRLH